MESAGVSASTGLSFRSRGSADDCCGPFESTLDGAVDGVWFGGAVSLRIVPRLAVDAEASWQREPAYSAYFQDPSVGGNYGNNRISTRTYAALARVRAWNSVRAAVDLLAGTGLAHETRSSLVESIPFRPLPGATRRVIGDTESTRRLVPLIVGFEVSTGTRNLGFFGTARLLLLNGPELKRTDLELGRQLLRFGAGIRGSF